MKHTTLIIALAGGAAALYAFMSGGRRTVLVNARQTTGTAKAPTESYDKLFAWRAQQPVIAGASGGTSAGATIGAAVDLVALGRDVWGGIRKLFNLGGGGGTPYGMSTWKDRQAVAEGRLTMTPYFSTQYDYDAAIKRSEEAAEAAEQDAVNAEDEYESGIDQSYGEGGLEAAYDRTGELI